MTALRIRATVFATILVLMLLAATCSTGAQMIAYLLASAVAVTGPVDISKCATVSPVTTSTDVAGLQRDADCYGAAYTADKAQVTVMNTAASAAKAAQKYRLDRIAYVKAHPAPPPVITPPPVVVPPTLPAPPPSGFIPAASLEGAPEIASNFDEANVIAPMGLPPTMAPDRVGAFRFICGPGALKYDDPIMFPGQTGRSHLHQFYGNTAADGNSTYESLRASGGSSCNNDPAHPDQAANRSSYWMPSMLDGKGGVKVPGYIVIYYKREPANSASCNDKRVTLGCVAQPNGLRWIRGRNMANLSQPADPFHFSCTKPSGAIAGAGSYARMSDALAVCPAGQGWQLTITFDGPECWDGKNLDSPDHRSHVGYRYITKEGISACPAATPYIIPVFRLTAPYLVEAGDDPTKWRFASDAMTPNEPAGSTAHLDLFDAWGAAKKTWTANCIDKLLSCTMGNLGNGTGLKGAASSATSGPSTVPMPPMPEMK
jgi:hypothetical protein